MVATTERDPYVSGRERLERDEAQMEARRAAAAAFRHRLREIMRTVEGRATVWFLTAQAYADGSVFSTNFGEMCRAEGRRMVATEWKDFLQDACPHEELAMRLENQESAESHG